MSFPFMLLVLIGAAAILLSVTAFQSQGAARLVRRVTGIVMLMGLAAFCAFGFLASDELSAFSDRLPWQLAYGGLGFSSLLGALCIALCGAQKQQT